MSYIFPITKIHSTLAEARKSFDGDGGYSWYENGESTDLASLAQGKRNLILGEPGVGKSLLIQRIAEHLGDTGVAVCLVELRRSYAMAQVERFLADRPQGQRAILLDALDEVKASDIPETIQEIEQIARENPDVAIYMSGRWVFISRHAARFPEYRIITISPFTNEQVKDYLTTAGHSDADVDSLLSRMMSFGHSKLVVQIPRYLSYLDEFLKRKGVEAAAEVSRNELFEYFIYSKLELEDKKLSADKRAMTKRVLEKLALTMETYQTNVISHDELMTFFDDVDSDLKRGALSQIELEVLYDYSILKVSHEDPDKIEFENAEFQEYLAAKEITRLPEPARAAFAFAADSTINEIYPTWYNALTFLVDMEPALLEQLVEFSGLRADKFRVLDERFLNFVARVDTRRIPKALRSTLFRDLISYHERTLQWLPHNLADALAGLADSTTDGFLKERVVHAESLHDAERFVRLANVSYVVGYLLKSGISLNKPFWRSTLIGYASDHNENGVLQRHALFAIVFLRDASVIDELPSLERLDELGAQELIDACRQIAPDHPTSVGLFIEAIRQDEYRGRYGLYEVRAATSIERYLDAFLKDEDFRRPFMNGASTFGKSDAVLVEHIEAVLDPDLRELAKQVLVAGMHYDIADQTERSVFMRELWKVLRKGDDEFVTDMLRRMEAKGDRRTAFFYAHRFYSEVIEARDVEPFLNAMKDAGETHAAHLAMIAIKFSGRTGAEQLYERGRPLLSKEYEEWEQARKEHKQKKPRGAEVALKKFRALLEPQPGKYSHGVFQHYNKNAEELDRVLSPGDRGRLFELFNETVFKFMDPGEHGITITSSTGASTSYTTSAVVRIFADAVIAARRLGFNLTPYRAKIINLVPFADSDELKAIFDEIRDLRPGELDPVIEVYKSRHSDLWRHNPSNFVRAVERYHVTEAAPVLKAFILEPEWERYARREAVRVLASIAPDPDFLRQVFDRYKGDSKSEERELAAIANGLLITTHSDRNAIRWRLQQVVRRAAPFLRPRGRGAHAVTALEDEITSKTFAQPLMQLKHPGYEMAYIGILEDALKLWQKGVHFYQYASYLWSVVFAYFENLKEQRSYEPLQTLEAAISTMRGRDGANWLAGRMANLRHAYVSYLGRPATIAKAVAKYNDARKYNDKEIRNSADLFRHVQSTLDTDLRRWIEGEGAYEILRHRISGRGRQEYEKLIQKTLKSQIENALIKRGFQVDVLREPQLLDEKRTDFLVRYGFAGPIVVEVKLTSNRDIQGKNIRKSASFISMDRYMSGYGAAYGIFMVVDNAGARNLQEVGKAFRSIQGVSVVSFDCAPTVSRKSSRDQGRTRTRVKAGRRRLKKKKA